MFEDDLNDEFDCDCDDCEDDSVRDLIVFPVRFYRRLLSYWQKQAPFHSGEKKRKRTLRKKKRNREEKKERIEEERERLLLLLSRHNW